jgi:hypothetical protein
VQAHQPLDPVQTAFDTIYQKVSPDAPCTVDPVAGKELAWTRGPIVSSLQDLALADRFSQAGSPTAIRPLLRIAMPPARCSGASR